MAYIINRYDGTQLAIVDDGILDNTTPLGLIGRNYTGYGETQNENFVFLLENFANISPPARALSGQAWYDTGAKTLKVYNGANWLSIGNATVSETEPDHSNGGLWLKVTTQQLFVSDGSVWRQVGPEAAEGFAVTKMTSSVLVDTGNITRPVILVQLNGETTGIYANDNFTISEPIPGFTSVIKGLNIKESHAFIGPLIGNASTASKLQTAVQINNVAFDGSSNITVTASTTNPIIPGDYIVGSEFNGTFETEWAVDATPENLVGKVVARDSVGNFTATTVNADLFGNVTGNVTAITGTSTFNNIVVDQITGNNFSGLAARATRLETPRLINTVPFNGTENITLPVPAETLTGNTLAPNIVDSSLTSLGKLVTLNVEAPGIRIGDGNNINIYVEGFSPTIESDVTNVIRLKLATGSVTISPTTVSFISASAASADGVISPAVVPDYDLDNPIANRPVLGLPSYRWKNIYTTEINTPTATVTTLKGPTVADQVTVSKDLVVNGTTFGALRGDLTGNVTGNVIGSASLNVLKTGDTISGDIAWNTSGRGIEWRTNKIGARIRFYNTGDIGNRLEFNTFDNGSEYFRWTSSTISNTYESMRLVPNSSGTALLTVTGDITSTGSLTGTHIGDGFQLTNLNSSNLTSGVVPAARLAGTYNISIAGNVAGNLTGNTQGTHTGSVIGNVTGAASLNILKTGDTMSGDLNWSTTGRGLTWGMNTDGASIRFYNISDGDTASRLEFQTTDNGNEYFSWTHASGSTFESMRLTPNSSGNAALRIFGNVTVDGTANGTFSGVGTGLTLNASNLTTGTVPTNRLSGTYEINITGNAPTATQATTATNVNGGSVSATTGAFSGRVAQSISGFHAASKEVISTRTDSGFYDWPTPTTANGWPSAGSWHHLLSSTHVNDANYYAMQFSADFYSQNVYYRSTAGNGATAWNKLLHSNNFNDYAPTKGGTGATGTWPISVTGNAATVTTLNSAQITTALGYTPVNVGVLTNQAGTNITGTTATFTGQVNVSTAGIKFPNDPFGGSGDAASITYETVGGERTRLRFRVTNDAGSTVDDKAEFLVPDNDSLLVNGYVTLNAANYSNYTPTKSGTGATGTWSINITGNANTVTTLNSNQITTALGYTPVSPGALTNQSGAAINGSTGTFSGKVTVAAGSTNGIYWPNDSFGGGGDTARITLETASGEATRMRFTMTNDVDDYFEFAAPSIDGLKMNGNTVLNAGNYNDYAPTKGGTGASGTWPINVTGNAATVTTVSSGQIASGLGYVPISKSGDVVNGEINLQDNLLRRATIVDYSLSHNELGSVAGSTTVNLESGNYASATAVGAVTWTFANPPTGARVGSLILELTNGGSYTMYWPSSVRWPSGSAPSLASSGVDVLVFLTDDSGANWRGAISMGDSR